MRSLYDLLARWPRRLRGTKLAEGWKPDRPAAPTSEDAREAAGTPDPWREFHARHTEGPGVQKWLHYLEVYERHLSRFSGAAPVLVEVGVASGGSLQMWRACLGPGCRVHGIDVDPACLAHAGSDVTIHLGDQADPAMWARFRQAVPRVDILIDDGGHGDAQQMTTLEAMLPHLQPGGVYICEDIHGTANRFAAFAHALCDALNAGTISSREGEDWIAPSPFQSAIHSIHHYPMLLVIEKRRVPLRRLSAPLQGSEWLPEDPP